MSLHNIISFALRKTVHQKTSSVGQTPFLKGDGCKENNKTHATLGRVLCATHYENTFALLKDFE